MSAAVPEPRNEPVLAYAPGSAERETLAARVRELAGLDLELTSTIGGAPRMAGGEPIEVVQPHRRHERLGATAQAIPADVRAAVDAAVAAAPAWRDLPFTERAAVFLR